MCLKFTASEDKPHSPMIFFRSSFPVIPVKTGRKRASISIMKVSGFPLPAFAGTSFAGMTGFRQACPQFDRGNDGALIHATIGFRQCSDRW